ncbi:MAG TPA: tRNA lysidine(34) synthetase TilS [Egibacteraceae bacterium]|nr:tRNA lysidine(34) synthetase TilS [Egibacteraceae bacterium]
MAAGDASSPAVVYGALPAGLDRADLVNVARQSLSGVAKGSCAVLAMSGGADSTALAYLVSEARPDLRAVAGHVRHGLRDDAQDARVATAHAHALSLPYRERTVRIDPRAAGGPEAAARDARYAALADIAQAEGAQWVLVGHTADDQAETVLLNLVRGSGLRGLSGMAPVRAASDVADPEAGAEVLGEHGLRILRPLLRVRREDVRAFVAGEGLDAVSDPTNRDPQQRRARARHDVLPALAALAGGPGDPVAVLTRLADLARDDADALDALAVGHARGMIVVWGPVAAVASDSLAVLPRALQARVVRLLLRRVRGGSDQTTADAVAGILSLSAGQSLHAPGGAWVTAGGGWLAVLGAGTPELAPRYVSVPGVTELPEIGLALHADRCEAPGFQQRLDMPAAGSALRTDAWLRRQAPAHLAPPGPLGILSPGARGPAWALLPAAGEPLRVRARRRADRIRLPAGSRKLQDVFVDAGVPRAARDLVPVITDCDDEPLWVPGLALRSGDPSATEAAGDRVRLWVAPSESVYAQRAEASTP